MKLFIIFFFISIQHFIQAQEIIKIAVTPNDPMTSCTIGSSYTGNQITTTNSSLDITGYEIEIIK